MLIKAKSKQWRQIYCNIYNNYLGASMENNKTIIKKETPLQESHSIHNRYSQQEFLNILQNYDVISFDMFDTLILRNVNVPQDVFTIMAIEMGFNDFKSARISAEKIAREKLQKRQGTREVDIYDIYDVLYERYNIDKKWLFREVDIEKSVCIANPYFKTIYDELCRLNKKIIVMTDMYLPKDVLTEILHNCGYEFFDEIFVSNNLKLCKGDGTLPKYVQDNFVCGQKVIHIGDNYTSDIRQTRTNGFDTRYYPSVHEAARPFQDAIENDLGSSFYRGIIDNELHNGTWNKNIYYEHGYKVGGILTYGFCQYIEEIAVKKQADLILFCSRDCDIISKTYTRFFGKVESEYVAISRFAMFMALPERYLYDLINRSIRKNVKESQEYDEIGVALKNIDLDFLMPAIEEETEYSATDLLTAENIDSISECILSHVQDVIGHNQNHIDAAKTYFKSIVGAHKNILVVDIGWSGSCITALKYLLEKDIVDIDVSGVLMFSNNNATTACSFSNGTISAYICGPYSNKDILSRQNKATEINNLCLEYLFSSSSNSLLYYSFDEYGHVKTIKNNNVIANSTQINDFHNGILDFVACYQTTTRSFSNLFSVTAYAAIKPFAQCVENMNYIKEVYKDFVYDAPTSSYRDFQTITFGNYLDNKINLRKNHGKILLISHEFSYTGAPHSLLRIAKVIKKLGYYVEVWGPKKGDFLKEFEREKLRYRIVPAKDMERANNLERLVQFDFCIINTILADEYYNVIRKYIPTAWYIREATNIPFCCKTSPTRLQTLKSAKNLYCVSEYAASFIRKYNKHVKIVNNCVEDMSQLAAPYNGPKDNKIKFIQLGTIEERKGYDLIVSAFEKLPNSIKSRVEFYFAGQLRPGFQADYWKKLLERIKDFDNIHYLGEIRDEELKARIISSMDVVVVASRDEACSLVALEGAMFSKPLLLSSNVGAKYMVTNGNGLVFDSDDSQSLANAIRYFVNNISRIDAMGKVSRSNYEQFASMEKHELDIDTLVKENLIKHTAKYERERKRYCKKYNNPINIFKRRVAKVLHYLKDNGFMKTVLFVNQKRPKLLPLTSKLVQAIIDRKYYRQFMHYKRTEDLIVASLTSYPQRINVVSKVIHSIQKQYLRPDRIVLTLSKQQFPNLEDDLPQELKMLQNQDLTIKWVDDDIRPHKKYFYVMQDMPNAIVITFDDDVLYDKDVISTLYESYLKHPNCVSCMRAHRMLLDKNRIGKYKDWIIEDNSLSQKESHYAVATGVGGVLYPPYAFGVAAFDCGFIKNNCIDADDLWLKAMELKYNRKVVLATRHRTMKLIEGTQATALYTQNVYSDGNDLAMTKIATQFPEIIAVLQENDEKR